MHTLNMSVKMAFCVYHTYVMYNMDLKFAQSTVEHVQILTALGQMFLWCKLLIFTRFIQTFNLQRLVLATRHG